MTLEQEESKLWLNRTYKEFEVIQTMKTKLETVRASVNKAVNPMGARETTGNADLNPQEKKLAAMIDLETNISEREAVLFEADIVTLDVINKLSNLREQVVLIERYVNHKQWREIEKAIHYGHAQTFRIHDDGLAHIYEYIPKGVAG